jgi:hypothetical protein
MLVTHGELTFDEHLPGNHLYGADICMQARLGGRVCYAIDAYCHHNSEHGVELPEEFERCVRYFARKYADHLPVSTTCVRVTGDRPSRSAKLRGFAPRLQRRVVGILADLRAAISKGRQG